MKKKVFAVAISMALAIGALAGCGGGDKAEAPPASSKPAASSPAESKPAEGKQASGDAVVLEVAFNQPETHPQYKAMVAFGEALKEKTNGQYSVEVFPNELLGAQKEAMEMVQSGTIAMAISGGSLLETWNPDFVVFNLPYIFNSIEQQQEIINDPEVITDLYNSIDAQGIHVLCGFNGGVRNIYNKKGPINTPEDLAGLKIRVMQADTSIRMIELMGGVGTPMGQGEVYTAIQTGVLDGAENNELIYSDLKHVEVAPYYSYTQHLMMPDYLVINTDLYNSLPDDVKTIFDEELQKAVDMEYELFDDAAATAKSEAEAAGAKFNDVDITIFQDAVAPLTEEKITSDMTKAIYEKIKASR